MRRKYSIIPAVFWLCFIWVLSSIPSKELPSLKIVDYDKLAHVFVYFVLGVLVNYWIKKQRFSPISVYLLYALLILLASLDEYHQTYIPGRSVSGYDFLANSCGLVLGWLHYKLRISAKPMD